MELHRVTVACVCVIAEAANSAGVCDSELEGLR